MDAKRSKKWSHIKSSTLNKGYVGRLAFKPHLNKEVSGCLTGDGWDREKKKTKGRRQITDGFEEVTSFYRYREKGMAGAEEMTTSAASAFWD